MAGGSSVGGLIDLPLAVIYHEPAGLQFFSSLPPLFFPPEALSPVLDKELVGDLPRIQKYICFGRADFRRI